MSAHSFQTGDIVRDNNGDLWRIVGRWDEPVVVAERVVEYQPHLVTQGLAHPEPARMTGGVGGLMWDGFERLLPESRA